jgi:hypothetical protein
MSLVSFVVLINVSKSGFFKPLIRLRQGFPLEPLIFMIIVEGSSRYIIEAKRIGALTRIVGRLFGLHLCFRGH